MESTGRIVRFGYLHSHDASAPVIRIVASGCKVVAMPSSDGITSGNIPSEIPEVKRTKSFINVTSSCNDIKGETSQFISTSG